MANIRDLQLNSGMRCAKYMLLLISFMFAITAILLIMVGTTIETIFSDFELFIDDYFQSTSALLVATGFIMILVATLGAYGAIKESCLLINLYGVFLFLVFILEVSAAIAAYVMQGQVRSMLVSTMNQALEDYESKEYVRSSVDFMQESLQCCGVLDPSDWKTYWSPNQNVTKDEEFNDIIVPSSCCGEFSSTDPFKCELQFQYGCLRRLDFIISQSTMLIATGATTVAFVQLLGVICAFMLAKTLRRNKSIREARRWQLQQSLGVLISGGKVTPPINSAMTGYTQLEKTEHYMDHDPITYTPNSPSVN